MAALDGTSSTRLLTSQTTHENPSSNNGKAVREFVVVLVLTGDRDGRFKEMMRRSEALRHCDTAANATEVHSFMSY
jgi:hypothetical protein